MFVAGTTVFPGFVTDFLLVPLLVVGPSLPSVLALFWLLLGWVVGLFLYFLCICGLEPGRSLGLGGL